MDPKVIAAQINPIDLGSTATVSVVLILMIKWLTNQHTRQIDEILQRQAALEAKIDELTKVLGER